MSKKWVASGAITLLLFVGLTGGIGWVGSLWWAEAVGSSWAALILYWAGYVLLVGSYLAAMLLRKRIPYPLYLALRRIGAYGLGFFYYAVLLILPAVLLSWCLRWVGVDPRASVLMTGWLTVGLMLFFLLYGARNAWSTVVRRLELVINKRAGDRRKELVVAAVSDLHLGTVIGNGHLNRLVDKLNLLKPDVILLAGDVLDDSLEPFIRANMAEGMKRLQAPLGVYACLGNHEYIGGDVKEYVVRMREAGVHVLMDELVLVADSFYVAGRKDKAVERFTREGRLPVKELLQAADPSLPILLLDHQPYGLDAAAEAGADLMLSGHTHRGQMMPNHLITRRLFELDFGYKQKGAMHTVVSSGYGFWGPPVRIGSRSEIVWMKLQFREG